MTKLVVRLNKSQYFRFFASVQLAVPLLLILICVVAAGTIIESRYNSEYARLLVYDAWWFGCLMVLLWINILLSTLSRYPYKLRHLGFVTVHIGMLTLLLGGLITKLYGIDGQLRVVEADKASVIELGDQTLDLIDVQSDSAIRAPFARGSSRLTGSSLDFLNEHFNSKLIAREYLPFAEIHEVDDTAAAAAAVADTSQQSGPVAVGFNLKSQFFNVTESLSSDERPDLQVGPAHLRLVVDAETASKTPGGKAKPAKKSKINSPKTSPKTSPEARQDSAVAIERSPAKTDAKAAGGHFVVRDAKSDKVLLDLPIGKVKEGLKLPNGVILSSLKVYKNAVVMQNHLAEGDPNTSGPGNPALEMQLQVAGQNLREIAYAKFPGFSLLQGKSPAVGFKVSYQVADIQVDPQPQMAHTEAANGAEDEKPSTENAALDAGSRTGNVIEFHAAAKAGDDQVRVVLYKNGARVTEGALRAGETMTTPWMGMQITLASVKRGSRSAQKIEAVPTSPSPRTELPMSAIYVTTAGMAPDQGFWLADGQFRQVQILGRQYEVYFGHRSLELPFAIHLLQFKKEDYPGTETPMSFSSRVKVNGQDPETLISMNEPLKYAGFTLYQSSYDIRPGQPRASIFSVNRDPGRPIKYAGGLILALGIITFTLMRSRVYQKPTTKKQ